MHDTCLVPCHAEATMPQLDVVFVHGLKGDSRATWAGESDRGDETFWPEWLAQDVPGVGVWSFGYPSTWVEWFSRTLPIAALASNLAHRIGNQRAGRRPLVFVGHSMGGLIIKHLLGDAAISSNPELKRLWLDTHAVMFLGTPHAGSDLASLGIFLKNCVTVFSLGSLVGANADELRHHAPALMALNKSFQQHVASKHQDGPLPRIVAYQETQPLLGVMVVEPHSADPNIPAAEVVPLPFNHATMCKHSSRQAAPYERLLQWAQAIQSSLPPSQLPLPSGSVFVSYMRDARGTAGAELEILRLVNWLRGQGIRVVVDLDFLGHRGPPVDWPTWVAQQVGKAETVLLIGHANYPALFDGNFTIDEDQTFGRAAVTQTIYGQHAESFDRFIALLKDGDPVTHLPEMLRKRYNHFRFPNGRQAILNAICTPPRILDNGAKP
jgi:pimeloyl-ACP methyl ester carboxylesterase